MISTELLKYLAYIWVTDGYAEFKIWVKDLRLLEKGFTVSEIKKTILEDSELMRYYIKKGTNEIIENPIHKSSCERLAKECLFWYEDNSHRI